MQLAIRTVLAATDLEEPSDEVLRAAAALASLAGAALHVVHVVERHPLPYRRPELDSPGVLRRREEAGAALEAQLRRAVPGVEPASREVAVGAAAREVLARAAEVGADLVVLGPHRGGELGAHFLGTTADRVVRGAGVPCLVAAGPLRLPVRRSCVPSDLSGDTRALETALAWAVALGGAAGGGEPPEVHLLHVGWTVDREDDPGLEERVVLPGLEREAAEALARAGGGRVAVLPEAAWAVDPAAGIVERVRRDGAGLVVMGTGGAGGVRRAVMGSVASAVARRAPCPVLLVPPADDGGP